MINEKYSRDCNFPISGMKKFQFCVKSFWHLSQATLSLEWIARIFLVIQLALLLCVNSTKKEKHVSIQSRFSLFSPFPSTTHQFTSHKSKSNPESSCLPERAEATRISNLQKHLAVSVVNYRMLRGRSTVENGKRKAKKIFNNSLRILSISWMNSLSIYVHVRSFKDFFKWNRSQM